MQDEGKALSARYRFSNLSPGDVLLSTVPRSSISAAVRVGTRSAFSHTAIYWGRLSFLEAVDVGVNNFNIIRLGVNELREWIFVKPQTG